jgi:hypothetical protein
MDIKDVMNHVREELREQPGSHFSEIYFRTVEHGANIAEAIEALTEILKRNEVRIEDDKWRLVAPVERRLRGKTKQGINGDVSRNSYS